MVNHVDTCAVHVAVFHNVALCAFAYRYDAVSLAACQQKLGLVYGSVNWVVVFGVAKEDKVVNGYDRFYARCLYAYGQLA